MSNNKAAVYRHKSLILFITIVILTSCSPLKKSFKKLDQNPVFANSFSGFVLLDPETNQVLLDHYGSKYFTPASNTKLFTFYVANRILGDSVPAFSYEMQGDSIWLWGTGDPSFLHPDLPTSGVFDFLKDKQVFLVRDRHLEPEFGPGWAWDDYSGSYQRPKSAFPIYANALQISWDSAAKNILIVPDLFSDSVYLDKPETGRAPAQNHFYVDQAWERDDTIRVPFFHSEYLVATLWSDTLGSPVTWIDSMDLEDERVFYSTPTDSVFKQMLQVSDNFLAEQLVLLCSWKLLGELNSKKTLQLLSDSLLNDLPQKPIWLDGSGLSRYNLFTPQSIAALLTKIYFEVGEERIFDLFPAGGKSGTIKEYYSADPPYIYAKTGTLRNNHSLSGYLITKRGKLLIFSFMHNNYPTGSHPIKLEMEKLLWQIHLKY